MNEKTVDQTLILDPLYLFAEEIKQKTIKKQSILTLSTIALVLGEKRTRQQLLPFLAKLFIKQNNEYRIIILKAIPTLLPYLGSPVYACLVLQLLFDILCVYSQQDVRSQAYIALEKTLTFINIRRAAKTLIKTLKQLNNESELNIRELVLKMIPYLYIGVDQEEQLLEILQSFKSKESDKILLSKQIKELIKVMPPAPEHQIKSIIELLMEMPNPIIKINLIESIILLTKILGEQVTSPYLTNIINDSNYEVVSAVIRRMKDLNQVFSQQSLKPIYQRIKNYKNQHQQVKNSILEVLQHLELSEPEKQEIYNPPSSLQLKNTLLQSLCRMHQIKYLKNLIDTSQVDFKIKIFPKLPEVCQMHIDLFESIFSGKNWRVKLNVLQNLQKRMDNQQNVEIFLPKLTPYLADKIAIIRVTVASLISKIILKKKIAYKSYQMIIQNGLSSQNWFHRQSTMLLLQELINSVDNGVEYETILKMTQKSAKDKVINIQSIAKQLITMIKIKMKQNKY